MAIIWVNISLLGSKKPGGQQASVASRGSAQSGALTLAIDNTLVTTRDQVRTLVAQALTVLTDQLKS